MNLGALYRHQDSIFTAYNSLQLGLAGWQKKSYHAASGIYTAQQCMLVTDAFELGMKVWRLYQIVISDYGKIDDQPDYQNESKKRLQFVLAAATSAIGLAAMVHFSKRLYAPTFDIGALSTASTTLSWHLPLAQFAIQWLYLSRMATNLALGYYTGENQLFLHTGLQLGSYACVTDLTWVRLDRTYHQPLNSVPFSQVDITRNYRSAIDTATVSMEFLIPSDCYRPEHYQTIADKIIHYSDHLFHHSHWDTYTQYTWHHTNNVTYYTEKLIHKVTVKKPDLSVGCCKQDLYLTDSSIAITDQFWDSGARESSFIFSSPATGAKLLR